MTKPPVLRCAVYTRKSTEEGLDQEYNSLHAQRDACEAYIRSQVGEGWACLKTAYDDGGISGGTMERPGLKQLLADITARTVDVVVVYKVDRLTRSLRDFSKIVDVFDKHGVSFVSVTQSFNTTSSMGRLTLNMLLSFAQFEREVTSERIRDKIAASKKKGMWMGGNLPLGYDADGRTLKVNEAEAETVRHIFRRYLETRSVHVLVESLKAEGVRSKRRETRAGVMIGGEVFNRGALFHLLSNRTYLGLITHKEEAYPGLHKAIVNEEVFKAAQTLMAANSVKRTSGSKRRMLSALAGKLFDEAGQPMSPTFSVGRQRRDYRYYASAPGQRGVAGRAITRVPAGELEGLVGQLVGRLNAEGLVELTRIDLKPRGMELSFRPLGDDGPDLLAAVSAALADGERAWARGNSEVVVSVLIRPIFRGGRKTILGRALAPSGAGRQDRTLVRGLRDAHQIAARQGATLEGHAGRRHEPLENTHQRKLAPLAFLAPDIQAAILKGEQPAHLTLSDFLGATIPSSWVAQRILFAVNSARSRGSTR